MEHNWLLYIAAFAVAFAFSMAATPIAKKISERLGAIDHPRERGMHKRPIPRMGGLAIVAGFFAAMVFAMLFMEELRTRQFLGFCIGASMIVVLGAFDDVKNLSAKLKLLVQIIAAVVVIATGTTINFVFYPFNEYTLLKVFQIPVTIIWIVGVTNAVNLIDGIDGLAAGVATIASLCLVALCLISGGGVAVIFSVCLAGACLGFLPYNFNPANVIMGDTGGTFLGFVLAVSSVMGLYKSYTLITIVTGVFAMALPIFDTVFAMARRFFRGKPIMTADRGHLHHRLIDSGNSTRKTVFILYGLSAGGGAIAILIALADLRVVIIVVLSLVVLSMVIYAYRKRIEKGTEDTKEDEEVSEDEKKGDD